MTKAHYDENIADLVHEKSIDILTEVGFCVPDKQMLMRLETAGFRVDLDSQMVRLVPELLDEALKTLPSDVSLHNRDRERLPHFGVNSCFMGAGTPVNVFDLNTGEQRAATRSLPLSRKRDKL